MISGVGFCLCGFWMKGEYLMMPYALTRMVPMSCWVLLMEAYFESNIISPGRNY